MYANYPQHRMESNCSCVCKQGLQMKVRKFSYLKSSSSHTSLEKNTSEHKKLREEKLNEKNRNWTKWSLIDHSTHHHSVSQIFYLLNNNNYERNLYAFEEEWESIEWRVKSTLMEMGTGVKRGRKNRPLLEEGSKGKEDFSFLPSQPPEMIHSAKIFTLKTLHNFFFSLSFLSTNLPSKTLFINIIRNHSSLNMCMVRSYTWNNWSITLTIHLTTASWSCLRTVHSCRQMWKRFLVQI